MMGAERNNHDCCECYRRPLIDTVNEESTPITITGRRGNAVLIGEADWSAIQETLYLQGIPGMADSLKEAAREDLDDALDDVEW